MSTLITTQKEAEIAGVVRDAAANKTPLKIIGGGTRQGLGHAVEGKPVSTSKLSGITLYEPASLTIVVEAGTPLTEVENALADNAQHLPFEPADYRALLGSTGEPTIGGVVACAISGSRRIQAGACRDSLIGVRFVNGEGEVIKSGGRVMKNVTGYDLVKLLAGSYGTLGIITQVSFKLLPAPEQTATVLATGLDDKTAVEAMSAALGSPFDISGVAHMPNGLAPGDLDADPVTMFRLEGFEKSVNYRSQRLQDLLSQYGSVTIENQPENTKATWKRVRDVESFADKSGAVWRLSLKPGDSPSVVETIRQKRQVEALYDWGGGLVWLLTPAEGDSGEKAIRAIVNEVGGHATLVRHGAKGGGKDLNVRNIFHPQSAAIAIISAELRRQFDPYSILNPGIMGN